MQEKAAPRIPRGADGTYDKETVRLAFMASSFLDWTRFAEEQGWDPHTSRREFPVRQWQEDKKRRLAEAQGDTLSSIIFERKFNWSHAILKTLELYPQLTDQAAQLFNAKMVYLIEMQKEYVEWRKAGKHLVYKKDKQGNIIPGAEPKRVYHPWEKVSLMDLSFLAKGMRELTESKIKSLMLDKWAVTKLDMPTDEMAPPPEGEEGSTAGRVTVEGKGEFSIADMQRWFDEFADKPLIEQGQTPPPAQTSAPSNEGPKIEPVEAHGVKLLDDNGRERG